MSYGDNLHEMSKTIFQKNDKIINDLLTAQFAQRMVKLKVNAKDQLLIIRFRLNHLFDESVSLIFFFLLFSLYYLSSSSLRQK